MKFFKRKKPTKPKPPTQRERAAKAEARRKQLVAIKQKQVLARRKQYAKRIEIRKITARMPTTTHEMKDKQLRVRHQLVITFDMRDLKTGEIQKGIQGFSRASYTKDYDRLWTQALKSAQKEAGGSNWLPTQEYDHYWNRYI